MTEKQTGLSESIDVQITGSTFPERSLHLCLRVAFVIEVKLVKIPGARCTGELEFDGSVREAYVQNLDLFGELGVTRWRVRCTQYVWRPGGHIQSFSMVPSSEMTPMVRIN